MQKQIQNLFALQIKSTILISHIISQSPCVLMTADKGFMQIINLNYKPSSQKI